MKRTQDSIIDELIDIMPYRFNENLRPYLKEAMDIWANTKLSELRQDAVSGLVCECNVHHRKTFEKNLNECRICGKSIEQTER